MVKYLEYRDKVPVTGLLEALVLLHELHVPSNPDFATRSVDYIKLLRIQYTHNAISFQGTKGTSRTIKDPKTKGSGVS